MKISNKVDSFKKRYSVALSENVLQHIYKVSQSLNSSFISYENKINALRNLMSEGGINISYAQELNKSLVIELMKLRSTEDEGHLFAPITISSLSEIEADKIQQDLIEKLQSKQGDFYFYFEQKIQDLFYIQGSQKCLIKFHKHLNENGQEFSQKDMDYFALVEEYIENYAKLISGENISWNKQLISDYIRFLENNIYIDSHDIEEKIKDIVKNVVCAPVLRTKEDLYDLSHAKNLELKIIEVINNLVKERTSDFDDLINDYKARFVNSINVLFENMNLEQFPDAVSSYIEQKKTEDALFFEDILDNLRLINDKKENLDEDLKDKGLYKFVDYPIISDIIAELTFLDEFKKGVNKNSAQDTFDSLVNTPNSPLGTFMKERNEYSSVIDLMLDPSKGDYFNLINSLNNYKFTENSTKNKVTLAIINSLESLALELRTAYLSTLSVKYRNFYNGELMEIRGSFTKINNSIHVKTRDELEISLLKENNGLLDVLSSTAKDRITVILTDDKIEAFLNSLLANNVKNWRHLGLWKPEKNELSREIEKLLEDTTSDFLFKKQEILQKYIPQINGPAVGLSILDKVCNLSKDILKVMAVVKTAGAAIPLFIEQQNNEVLQCTNSVESLIKELEFKLDQKEIESVKEELISTAKESPESLQSTIELLKEKHDLKTTIPRILLEKINSRYNVFSNKKDVVEYIKKEIVKVRNKLDEEVQLEMVNIVNSKKTEVEIYLKDLSFAENILLSDN